MTAALLSVLVYLNALDNPFVYDDYETVVANPSIVDPSNVRFVLSHSPFRPVVNLSYALDRTIWGYRPLGYHLTNVLLHAMVVVLLYVFLLRALADVRARRRTSVSEDSPDVLGWIAFAGASIFGVHPLMTEAVAYVTGRSEVLCGMFFMAAILLGRSAILQSQSRGQAGRQTARRPIVYSAAIGCAVLAALSKEVGLTVPFVLLTYDWLVLPHDAEVRSRRWRTVMIPALLLVAAAAEFRLHARDMAGVSSAQAQALTLLTQSIVIWRYIGLFLLPVGQSIMHGVHRVTTFTDPVALLGIAGLSALLWLAFRIRRAEPLASLALIWYFAVIAPSSSVFALREGMAEHRAYFATIGIVIALAALLAREFERRSRNRSRVPEAYGALLGCILLALCTLTVNRNAVWASPAALWREATLTAPNMWEPHYALGDVLRESGDCAGAVEEYQIVVRLRPMHRDAETNLGICLAQLGRLDEAEAAFRKALNIDPQFARGYTNLGALALVAGDPTRARDFYVQAIAIDPRNVLARMQLARLYEGTFKEYRSAARMCGEARAIAPATPGVVECVERNESLAAAHDAGR